MDFKTRNVKRKCKAKLIQLHISLEEAYNEGSKKVKFDCRVKCNKCKGTGSANPDAKITCETCKGKGVRVVIQRMGNMVLQSQQPCDVCHGEGKIIKEKCKDCKGEGVKKEKKEVTLQLDKGVPDGHRYTMRGEGDQYPDVETGDLVLEINLDTHKNFIRKGADLVYKKEISLLQALTGIKFVITHLDGRKIIIFTKPGEIIRPQKLKTVKELGMPFFNSPVRNGNLYIDFQIQFPSKLDEQQTKKITEILKNDKLHTKTDFPKNAEEYFLQDFNKSQENTNHKGGRNEDYEDEESGEGTHQTVQCAQQ